MPLKSLIERLRHAPAPAPAAQPFPRKELAVAALLIEAAQVDRRVSQEERIVVARLVRERLALPDGEAARLLELANGEVAAALDDWVFTQAVREGFPEDEREEILGMIWEVVYADRQLARFEDLFMQRVAQALGVNAQAAERARGRAFARAGAENEQGGEA
jgi:uncharacterized tellurite resistance protein B-like protein